MLTVGSTNSDNYFPNWHPTLKVPVAISLLEKKKKSFQVNEAPNLTFRREISTFSKGVLMHVGFSFVVQYERYCSLRFGLKNYSGSKSLFYCGTEKKKRVRHQWASWKTQQGFIFPSVCVCALSFFPFLEQSSGNPTWKQLMACSMWWLNLIWLAVLEMDR